MNFTDIQQATQLSQEKSAIQRACLILTTGGKITAMTVTGGELVSGPDLGPPMMGGGSFFNGNSATVQTQYMEYPPQMTDAIVSAFQTRLREITEELGKLGVTGMEQAQPQHAAPTGR